MCAQFNADELTLFHAVKAAFDPAGLLNPGKNVPTPASLRRVRRHARPPRSTAVPRTGAFLMSQPYFDRTLAPTMPARCFRAGPRRPGARAPLRIVGGDSKAFRRPVAGEPLALAEHRGIVAYDPCELVITARAGTPLDELQAVLARGGQMPARRRVSAAGRRSAGACQRLRPDRAVFLGGSGTRFRPRDAADQWPGHPPALRRRGDEERRRLRPVAVAGGQLRCSGWSCVSFKVLPMPRCQAGLSLTAGGDGVAQANECRGEASHCRSVPATTAKPAPAPGGRRGLGTLGARPPRWRSARGRLLPTCASSACRSSTTRDRSGACRCRRWRRRRRCPVVSC